MLLYFILPQKCLVGSTFHLLTVCLLSVGRPLSAEDGQPRVLFTHAPKIKNHNPKRLWLMKPVHYTSIDQRSTRLQSAHAQIFEQFALDLPDAFDAQTVAGNGFPDDMRIQQSRGTKIRDMVVGDSL